MALEMKFEDATGVVHKKAYARINRMIYENPVMGPKNVFLEVTVYASKDAKDTAKNPVWGPQGFLVHLAEEDPAAPGPNARLPIPVMEGVSDPDKIGITDCYAWLKTQPQFKESKDV